MRSFLFIPFVVALVQCGPSPKGIHSIGSSDPFPDLPDPLFRSYKNVFNQSLDGMPADPNSSVIMASVIAAVTAPDSDKYARVELTIPYNVIATSSTPIHILGVVDANENYRVPADTVLFPELLGTEQQVSDSHRLIVNIKTNELYELYGPDQLDATHWSHHGAAVFDLTSDSVHSMAYDGYTSADAAGMPILPGLVRYDELKSGVINHALRMTFSDSQLYKAHTYPAMHHSNGNPYSSGAPLRYLPMGARLRLKSSIDPEKYTGAIKTIVVCLKRYGVIVADIGTGFAISGTSDSTDVKQLITNGFGYYGDATSSSIRLLDTTGRDIYWSDFEIMPIGNISTCFRNYPDPCQSQDQKKGTAK